MTEDPTTKRQSSAQAAVQKAVQAIADSDDSREVKLAELARVRRYVDAAWEQVQEGAG